MCGYVEAVPLTAVACRMHMDAWLDYRDKQENIVEYLLEMCRSNDELHAFVRDEAEKALQAKLGGADSDTSSGASSCCTSCVTSCNSSAATTPEVTKRQTSMPVPVSLDVPPSEAAVKVLNLLMAKDQPKRTQRKAWADIEDTHETADPQEEPKQEEMWQEQRQLQLLKSMMGDTTDTEPTSDDCDERRTTVVFRLDITNRKTQPEVVTLLSSEYNIIGGRDMDFLYCPTDFRRVFIKGYAIINLHDAHTASMLVASGREWSWAKVQGSSRNASLFLKRHTHVRNLKHRPLIWPSRQESAPFPLQDDRVRVCKEVQNKATQAQDTSAFVDGERLEQTEGNVSNTASKMKWNDFL